MLHPSTKRLIDKLIEMTSASKITWAEGDDGTCIYDTEGYRVTIGQSPSRVVLLDAGGRVLETVSDSLLANTIDTNGLQYTVKVDQLVSTARRQITGATDVIDRIVTALDLTGKREPPAPPVDEAHTEEDDVEDEAPVARMTFPDQPEMASRVAMLAEKLNGHLPPDTETGTLVVEEVSLEEIDLDELATDDDSDPDEASEESSAWTLPEGVGTALEAETDEVIDHGDDAIGFSPTEVHSSVELSPVKDEPSAPAKPVFGAIPTFEQMAPIKVTPVATIGPEIVPEEPEVFVDIVAEAEAAEALLDVVEEALAEPVLYFAPILGTSRVIDALSVTPDIYTTPLVQSDIMERELLTPTAADPYTEELPDPIVEQLVDDDGEEDESEVTILSETTLRISGGTYVDELAEPQLAESSVAPQEVIPEDEPVYEADQAETSSPELVEDDGFEVETTLETVTDAEPEKPAEEEPPEHRPGRRTVYKYNPWM
ncbi:hypothetical protein [Ponticaulis sp.]|uniref:hypothetical protein n=1 Tax=Ponticaulis sp. TaxID=2020902 RepID=UPI000B6E024A|nr:hypothetical protein [Ponticaulis sp.]MAI89974.1 hypothetical protein [Ponticaulis sp.]OUX99639.1 MAG: hypothetical protein CBB65_05990 [Hyphomonadaceae bacterium TMED5]|tara:strand:- start:33000 stop:34454 length:1455 start_codon:yes stop_codon:yes gene_type:complete